jgi:hypothetical protein
VWRWQQRFAEEGIEGLLRDKTRPPGKPPVPPETVAQVLAITCSEPPGEVTHWTGRAVAEKVGLALRTIQRIWRAQLTRRRLRRGDFISLVDLQAAIKRYIAEHNNDPRPFVWTKPAKLILDKINRHAEPPE